MAPVEVLNDICSNTDLDVAICDCARHARPTAPTEPGVYQGIPDDVVSIPVGEGHFALVDDTDSGLVSRYNWHLLEGHNGKLYAHAREGSSSIYMHRLIAATPDGLETDHINGNGLDNRRRNLRTATASENSANTWKPRRASGEAHSSKYKGVTRTRYGWVAKITVAQKCRYLGTFGTEDIAADAYDKAAADAWGEFAQLNLPKKRDAMSHPTGIFDNISDDEYHRDKASLSSSGARLLLDSSPRKFRYLMDHPQAPKTAFEHGSAAHALVLGVGAPLVEIPFDEWRTKESKQLVAEARAAGSIPLKPADFVKVHAMAAEILDHPLVSRLFANGVAEESMWWIDPDTGARLRARFDWRTYIGGRLIIVDYKTTTDSAPPAFAASAGKWGYYCQDAFYREAAKQVGLDDDPGFVFVAQEKDPPYGVTVHQYGPDDVEVGHGLNQRAVRTFADCTASGVWPDFPPVVHSMSMPKWARYQYEESLT